MRGSGRTTDVGMRRRARRFMRRLMRGGQGLSQRGRLGRAQGIRGGWYMRWGEWSVPMFSRRRTRHRIRGFRHRYRSPMGRAIRGIRSRLAQRCDTFCVRRRSRGRNRSGRGYRWIRRSTICIGIRAVGSCRRSGSRRRAGTCCRC